MTTTQKGLQSGPLESYRTRGYVVQDELLRPAKFRALQEHFERKLVALPPGKRPEDMDVPHFTDPDLFQWLLDDDVLDVVESLLGPDIALFSSHFFCKPAGDGKSVPWHKDDYYWRETIDPASEAITIWLALDPSLRDNGCMRVIPGSHTTSASRYRGVIDERSVFDEELDPAQVDESGAVDIELQPGQCSIHSAALIHGSQPNLSPRRRCGFTMRYIATRVRFNHDLLGHKHQIYLARGVDRVGNVYADPGNVDHHLVEARGSGQSYLGVGKDEQGAHDE